MFTDTTSTFAQAQEIKAIPSFNVFAYANDMQEQDSPKQQMPSKGGGGGIG